MNMDTQNRLSSAESSLLNQTKAASAKKEELRKQDFMNLFMTQMSHQDPMDPMDSGAMMTQLAQLGSMEQLENMNSQLKEMNLNQKDITRYQALQFLDKDVLTMTETLDLSKGSGNPIHYSLDKDMDSVKVTVEEMDGSPVFSSDLGLVTAGRHQFVWDGKNNEGTLMGNGKYRINLMATSVDGGSKRLDAYNSGRVSQLEYRKGQPWVKIKDEMMPLSKVKTVDNLSSRIFNGATPLPIVQNLEPKGIITDTTKK